MLHGYDSRHLGLNYRMPELAAALGAVQMDKLQGFLGARARNARHLMKEFEEIQGARFTQDARDRSHVFYLYTLYLRRNRDAILKRLNGRGVGAAVYFHTPVHRTPLYAKLGYATRKLKMTEAATKHVLSLPVHPAVTRPELETIAREFSDAARDLL
jgi:dTDP-4-amino-4,6-dideoxygalactose transaminase